MSGPTFNNNSPSVDDYMREYGERFQTMERLAMALMEVAEGVEGPMRKTLGSLLSADEIRRKLSDEHLRAAAAQIPLEVTKR